MSALAKPLSAPSAPPEPRPIRPVEVAPTRAQRRARPKVAYALLTLAGLFAILFTQLLLSIVTSEGAYEIAALQQQSREIQRDQELLVEQLHVLESPQHLAANAVSLGMVGNRSTAYLRLDTGAVLGSAVAASPLDGIVLGEDGRTLVGNTLLTGVPLAGDTGDTPVAAPGEGGSESVASTQEMPAISTR